MVKQQVRIWRWRRVLRQPGDARLIEAKTRQLVEGLRPPGPEAFEDSVSVAVRAQGRAQVEHCRPWPLGRCVLRPLERARVGRGSAREWRWCRQAKHAPCVRQRGGHRRQENGEDVRERAPVEDRDVAQALPGSAQASLLGQQTLVRSPHGDAQYRILRGRGAWRGRSCHPSLADDREQPALGAHHPEEQGRLDIRIRSAAHLGIAHRWQDPALPNQKSGFASDAGSGARAMTSTGSPGATSPPSTVRM